VKISTKGIYGVRAIFDLALHYGGDPVQRSELSGRQSIPEAYLVQVLSALVREGYVRGIRGPHGGYSLVKPPSEITVGEILELLEGPMDPVPCPGPEGCSSFADCVIRDVWEDVKEAIRGVLFSVTFGEMCERYRSRKAPADYVI